MKLKKLLRIGTFAAPLLSDFISTSLKEKQVKVAEYDREIQRLKARDDYKEKTAVFNTPFWGFVLVLFFNIFGLMVSLKYGNKRCRESSVATLKWLLIVITTLIIFLGIFFTIRTLCTL